MIRFYLDEHVPLAVAAGCRQAGLDVVTVRELGRLGWDDRLHVELATQDGRCVVTRDYRDFQLIASERAAQGLPLCGLVLIANSMAHDDIGGIIKALVSLRDEHPDGLDSYAIVWLSG